jgi:hypothetical protein
MTRITRAEFDLQLSERNYTEHMLNYLWDRYPSDRKREERENVLDLETNVLPTAGKR